MTHQQLDNDAVVRLCNGDAVALDWVNLGRQYCHLIDDLVDEDLPRANVAGGGERTCKIGALALELYSHPFWMRHWQALKPAMMLNTIKYADSLRWENGKEEWQRQYSDWARHGWLEVCMIVGTLCGGYDCARNESAEMIAVAWQNHHDVNGKPV